MLNDFFTFVRSQPNERVIGPGTWNNCAVGDFIKESLKRELLGDQPIPTDVVNALIMQLSEQYPELYVRMNESSHHTYNELQEELP